MSRVGKSLFPFLLAALLGACSSGTKPDCTEFDTQCSQGVNQGGSCVAEPINEGVECDDRDRCTLDDVCQLGECIGTPMDCDDFQDECNLGVCSNGECSSQAKDDGTPCLVETSECRVGACASGECQGTDKPDGTPCNDGDWCTNPDTCTAGVCQGSARDCSDGLDCTADSCDPDRFTCDHTAVAGTCFIDNACHADGDPNPGNPCQECQGALSGDNWTDDDTNACDDGNACTTPDFCLDGVCNGTPQPGCCASDADCDDSRDCTDDLCNTADGTCSNPVITGFCLIGATCWPEGALNPANACQKCQHASLPTDWTNHTDPCDDGVYCTGDDRCSLGACSGTAGLTCSDSLDCTTDSCDEGAQSCGHAVIAGFCSIGGACFSDTAPNPGNPCQVCDSSADQTDWSPDDSAACDDGNDCTDPDFCSAGTCTGTPLPNCCNGPADCSDSKDCTDDICDVPTGTCSNPVLAGYCHIAGACYDDGDPNPNNRCQACAVATAQESWSTGPDGSECGDVCRYCQAGACVNVPDTGDGDPFGECPACQVCNGLGGCRNAVDGTDPKDECTASECENDNCLAGSCFINAGTPCTDSTPADCNAAQCDTAGACVQDFTFEPVGTACDDGDTCTDPDACNALGQCAGTPLAPLPDPDSPVSATSLCLTTGTGAIAAVRVDLQDLSGTPISGATVTIESPAATWSGPVVESTALPGTYYRLLSAPAAAGSATVTVTAATGSGGCATGPVTLNASVTIQFVGPATANTGGCSPLDGNLRVKVTAAEDDTPIAGAYVMVGPAEATVFDDDFENVLAGSPTLANTGTTDANGVIEFTDLGTALDGPRMVTVGHDSRSYLTLVDADASDLVLPLEAIVGPPPTSQVDGILTGITPVNFDDVLDMGMVLTEFTIADLAHFRLASMIAEQSDCWLAVDHWAIGDMWVEMPVNIYIPEQRENYFVNLTIFEHPYKTVPIPDGSVDHHITGVHGTAPWGEVAGLLIGGSGGLSDVVPLLDMHNIGVITTTINGDQNNVPIDMTTSLTPNVNCTIANKPAGSDSMCLALGDWRGTTGDGPMFVMGFKQLTAGQGMVTSVPAQGDFSGIGFVGLGVAAFIDIDSLPPDERWKSRATAGVMDRTGISFSGSGGTLTFDDFMDITELIRSGRTYSWDSVDMGTNAHYTEHHLDLVSYLQYIPGPGGCDSTVIEDLWRSTYWKVLTPGQTLGFTLPDLPANWPRWIDGGLVSPAFGERLVWSFGAYHLGLLSSFDFNAFDFVNALTRVTHTSTNFTSF
jgi:hypothetical protein